MNKYTIIVVYYPNNKQNKNKNSLSQAAWVWWNISSYCCNWFALQTMQAGESAKREPCNVLTLYKRDTVKPVQLRISVSGWYTPICIRKWLISHIDIGLSAYSDLIKTKQNVNAWQINFKTKFHWDIEKVWQYNSFIIT